MLLLPRATAMPPPATGTGCGDTAPPACAQWFFADAEEQALALQGWNQTYLQLSAGSYRGSVRQVQGRGGRIFVERVEQSVRQTGLLRDGVLALGIPLRANGCGVFCGAPCADDVLHVFSGASGFEFRPPRQHTMLGIELQLGPVVPVGPPDDGRAGIAVPREAGALRLPHHLLSELRAYLLGLFRAARHDPDLLSNPAVLASVADFLLDRIGQPGDADRRTGDQVNHWTMVRQACARIEATLGAPPTIAHLCVELGVSRRTLQSAFQRVLGVAPLAYLKSARLHEARRALKQVRSVTEAATGSGFWHFGHFAHDYQALFGEKPSDTLRRHAARA